MNLNISQEGTIATIIIDKYLLPDNFDITFFNKEEEVIYGSGKSSGIRIFHSDEEDKNQETNNLKFNEDEEQPKEPTSTGFSRITGAVIGASTSSVGIIVLIFLIILVTECLFIKIHLKKNKFIK